MRDRLGRLRARLLVAGAVSVSVIAIALPAVQTGGGVSTANIWVELGAGACAGGRSATPIDYAASASPDRRCGTLDQANDAMSSGDLACIKPGTYPGQLVTGNKTSATTFKGCEGGVTFAGAPADPNSACPNAPGVDPFQTGILCVTANFFTLDTVTIDQEDTVQEATGIGQANGADITFRNVSFHGERPSFQAQGDRFHWDGGEIGQSGQPAGQRWCGDGNPMTLNGDGTTIENLTIWPQGSDQTPWSPGGPCGGGNSDNGFHLENIRVEGAAGVTIRRVDFTNGSEAGSGHIFFTGAATASATMEGNHFGTLADGSYAIQVNSTVGASCPWTWRYNTFRNPITSDLGCHDVAGSTWVGNLGAVLPCAGTRSGNVYQAESSNGCSGHTWVSGPHVDDRAGGDTGDHALSSLNVNTDGTLQAGSEAIDAAGSTCPTVTPDIDGTVRPQGSACDAGAFEKAG